MFTKDGSRPEPREELRPLECWVADPTRISEEQPNAFIVKVQANTSLQEQLKAEGADTIVFAKAIAI